MKKIDDKIMDIPRNLVGILFIIIIFLTIAQVFFRFLINRPLIWSEELVRFLLIWMTMIGAAVLSYDDVHLNVTSFVELLNPRGQFFLYTIRQIFIWIFLIATAVSSVKLVKLSHMTVSGALNIPFSFWRGAAPAGCVLMFITSFTRYIKNLKLFRQGTFRGKTIKDLEKEGDLTE